MDVGWMERDGGAKDNPRGSNRRTSGRSCARAWGLNSAWPLSRHCCRSSCILIRGLRVRRLYTANLLHCIQDISNVLVVLRAH